MGDQHEIPKTETPRTTELSTYSVWVIAITETGVSVPANVIIDAVDEEAAADQALRFIAAKGILVTLMGGAPPLPARVAGAVPYRVEKTSRIAAAANIPEGRTH